MHFESRILWITFYTSQMMKISSYWPALRSRLSGDLIKSEFYVNHGGREVPNRFALLDAGQLPRGSYVEIRKQISGCIDLFALTRENRIAEYGPILIPVYENFAHPTTAALLRTMRYGWVVSWLSSYLSLDELAEHLAGHLNGNLVDEGDVLIRYYDPRLLPCFLCHNLLTSTKSLMQPVCHWAWWDRTMNLVVYEGNYGKKSPGVTNTNIREKTRAAMASFALSDFIHAELLKGAENEEFSTWLPHMISNAVFAQIEKARSFGLSLPQDLQLYTSLSLMIHPRFFELSPIFFKNKENIKRGEVDMATLTLAVDDGEWTRLGSSGRVEIEELRVAMGDRLCRQ
jgi:hypothetical protein